MERGIVRALDLLTRKGAMLGFSEVGVLDESETGGLRAYGTELAKAARDAAS